MCKWVRKSFALTFRNKVTVMCDINLPSVILAGGRSQRMKGKDKSFLEVGDKTLLDLSLIHI